MKPHIIAIALAITLLAMSCADKYRDTKLMASLQRPFVYEFDYGQLLPPEKIVQPKFKDQASRRYYQDYVGEYASKAPTKSEIVNNLFQLRARKFAWGTSYSLNKYSDGIFYNGDTSQFGVADTGGIDYLNDLGYRRDDLRISGPGISNEFYKNIIREKIAEAKSHPTARLSQADESQLRQFLTTIIGEVLHGNIANLPPYIDPDGGIEIGEIFLFEGKQAISQKQAIDGARDQESIFYKYFHLQGFFMDSYKDDPVSVYVNTFFSCDRSEASKKFPGAILVELFGGPYNFQHIVVKKRGDAFTLLSWYSYFDME